MSEFRKDPIFDNWTVIAQDRGDRPRRTKVKEWIDSSSPCPLCPGNEGLCPPEISRIEFAGRWETRAFPNRYPALSLESDASEFVEDRSVLENSDKMFHSLPGFGVHEVIVESANHLLPFWALDSERALSVMELIQGRIQDLYKDRRIRYIQVFKNHRPAAGGSLEHPHFQLVGLPIVPAHLEKLWSSQSCRVCDYLEHEVTEGKESDGDEYSPRWLAETSHFVAYVDYAPRYPYQFSIYPKVHGESFEELPQKKVSEVLQLFSRVYKRYEQLVGEIAFNLIMHSPPPPSDFSSPQSRHWFLRVHPRTGRKAGFELATWIDLVHVHPESFARQFREVSR